jgi:uncharacterized tellurite resistance protein B-like protein
MRSYPPNSPHAAARVVALAAIADGHFSRKELDVLEGLDAPGKLGLSRADLHQVIQHLTEDLMATAHPPWGTACQIDRGTLHSLLAEVTEPGLRLATLELCVAVANADRHVAEAEESLIDTATKRWLIDASKFGSGSVN